MIFLASQSKRRKELLRNAKIPFRLVPSTFEEQTLPGNSELSALTNALGKATYAKVNANEGIILGADTIVYFENQILGKPKSKRDAITMLFSLSGTKHAVYTGVALFDLSSKSWRSFCVKSMVTMRKFSKETVQRYFSKVNPLDKAGAYAIQEHGDQLVTRIQGSYTNVVGLPMEVLKKELKRMKKTHMSLRGTK